MLLTKSEKAGSRAERARAFAEIGKVYANEQSDKEQALVGAHSSRSAKTRKSRLS